MKSWWLWQQSGSTRWWAYTENPRKRPGAFEVVEMKEYLTLTIKYDLLINAVRQLEPEVKEHISRILEGK